MSLMKPANLNIKPMPDENPYELSPVLDADSIEMRNHLKFAPLPQDPPVPPAPAPRQRTEETNLSTGQAVSPTYKNPPAYNGRPHHHGHHFYEEVNQSGLKRESNKPSVYGSPNSLPTSHTEVDQAMLYSQSSTTNSLAQLTEPVEKKPRKKTNPLYDSYREDDDTLDTRTYPSDFNPVKEKSPGSCIGSVLRHPCTIVLLIAVIIALIVFFVLLLLGTITSKVGQTAAQTQNESSSEVMAQLRKQVDDQNTLINTMMQKIERLEMAIVSPGNENASLEIRVAQNTFMLMNLNESLTELDREVISVNTKAEVAYEQSSSTISTQVAFLNRIIVLENQTKTLDGQVNSLRGNLQTHSGDIVSIQTHNSQQDNEITRLNGNIAVVEQELKTEFIQYNESIYQELERISKMQGPRGFNGSDGMSDLTQCSYQTANKGSAASQATTTTSPISADGVTEILTGVSCSTFNGERALLRTTGTDPVEFTCECSGIYPAGQVNRYCHIHYWRCPVMT